MADDDHKIASWRIICGFFGVMITLAGMGIVEEGNRFASKIDPEQRCDASGTEYYCFTDRFAVVEQADGDRVTVAYEGSEGSDRLTTMTPTHLTRGTRVRVERWEDEVVSLYAPTRNRRYRTDDWPRRWDPTGFVIAPIGLSLLLAAIVPSGARILRQAATSKGKP